MKENSISLGIVTICLIVLTYSIHILLNTEIIYLLTKEDGVFESGSAILFFLTGILFLIIFFKNKIQKGNTILRYRKNIFFLLLAIVFVVGCLEEISWGQRIFNFETPANIAKLNNKNETNLHNLVFFARSDQSGLKTGLELMLNIDRMFSLFWFTYCCLLPILYKYSSWIKTKAERIHLPVPPLFIVGAFIVNYSISKLLIVNTDTITRSVLRSFIEIKEFNLAMLFFTISAWFYFLLKNNPQKV